MHSARRYLIYFLVMIAALLSYVPFRLVANQTNTVFRSGSDDFHFRFAIFLWPVYSFLVPLVTQWLAVLFSLPWYSRLVGLLILFVAWDSVQVLDDWFAISGIGIFGWNAFPSNYPGINTPHLSVILCSFTFLLGVLTGELLPRLTRRKTHAATNVG